DARARALARSISSEMHSGFQALRAAMPMNIRSSHPGKGQSPEALRDIERIAAIWRQCRESHGSGGDMLFGHFTTADAMYAPVVMRLKSPTPALAGPART